MMRIHKISVGIGLLTLLAAASMVLAQGQTTVAPGGGSQQSEEAINQSRAVGITIVRHIVTAEVEYKFRHGAFASWEQLFRDPDEQARWQKLNLSVGPEVAPSWLLRLVPSADGNSFDVSLRNSADKCAFTFFSDERGVIYQGGAIDCGIVLKPAQ